MISGVVVDCSSKVPEEIQDYGDPRNVMTLTKVRTLSSQTEHCVEKLTHSSQQQSWEKSGDIESEKQAANQPKPQPTSNQLA